MKIDKSLSEVFDMDIVEESSCTDIDIIDADGSVIVANTGTDKEQIDADFNKSRNNLYNLLQQGEDALQASLELAKGSENPKAFDAFAKILSEVRALNSELLETHAKKQKVTGVSREEQPGSVTNNNAIFVGTTSELKKMLKEVNK